MPTDVAAIGLTLPEILLPADGVDLRKWSVIACDQFTSDRSYWEAVERSVGDAPSTLRITLPEVYLEDDDREQRVEDINRTMDEYLDAGLLVSRQPGWVLVDRSTPLAASRKGLVLAVDLESYSFHEGADALIRPTEGTVLDRLPPRMAIRRGASLDLPHILLLIDDPGRTVIEPLFQRRDGMEKLYDFDLQQGGGHVAGWFVDGETAASTAAAFEALVDDGLLFAVGDGNHSLATAKQLWEERKKQGAADDDPARYILLEVENIHDPGLAFHPINRVLFGVDADDLVAAMESALGGAFAAGPAGSCRPDGRTHSVGITARGREGVVTFTAPGDRMTVEYVQDILDEYLSAHPPVSIDYVHDEQPVRDLAGVEGNAGIFLPPVDTAAFFDRIRTVGPYPRKTFSIGEAHEKRYYIEARRLKTN